MLGQTPYSSKIPPSNTPMLETIQSRFGVISVDTSKALFFPHGLLGMPGKSNFIMTAFPKPNMTQFMLLQSLDDANTSFITLPISTNNPIIEHNDIVTACNDLQMNAKAVAILLIITVHRGADKAKLSVNARAPLFLDSDTKIAAQYVFQKDAYNVQHML
jgi:flagellar assembly factor FliW